MAHIYAIVVTDEEELGFDSFSERVNERLTTGGVGANWLSNPLIPRGSPDDFHAIVLERGDMLDSLDAEDNRRTPIENLRAAVQDVDGVLRSLYGRVDGTGLAAGLEDALDRWDAWASQFKDPAYVAARCEEPGPAAARRGGPPAGQIDHELVERSRRALSALGVEGLSESASESPALLVDVVEDPSGAGLAFNVNSAHPDRRTALRSIRYDGVNVLPVLLFDLSRLRAR